MKAFAFVVPAITIKEIKNFWPLIRGMPTFLVAPFLKNMPPYKISQIKRLRSIQGEEIEGYFIACPLFLKHTQELEKENIVINKIIEAGRIAKRFGAKIIGLGGDASIIGDKIYTIAEKLKMPVTNGNALAAWSVFEAIYRMARIKKIDLKKCTLAVIGATNFLGSLCAKKFSYYTTKIIITATHRDKLEQLKEKILYLNSIEIIIEEDAHKAVKDADVVIITSSLSDAPLNIEELRPNAIICNASMPKNSIVGRTTASRDIAIIDGGLIKMPYPANLGINTRLPKGIVHAFLAETMLLTFAERFVSYSLDDNINLDKLEEIADIAAQHGFEVWVPEAPVL